MSSRMTRGTMSRPVVAILMATGMLVAVRSATAQPQVETPEQRQRAIDEYNQFIQNLGQSQVRALAPAAGRIESLPPAATPRPEAVDPAAAAAARQRLRQEWQDFTRDPAAAAAKAAQAATARLQAEGLPQPQRVDLARASERPFVEPPVICSKDGVLRARLIVNYSRHTIPKPIGEDKVLLRNYNGQLVGPTLHARPGDTLRIVLDNRLTPETHPEPDLVLLPSLPDPDQIPATGTNQIIVAQVNGELFFRAFDDGGVLVRDTREMALPDETTRIAQLKVLLAPLLALPTPVTIPQESKARLLAAVATILDNPAMNTYHGLNTTNLHTHGLHVSPVGNSDNVMLQINGGDRFEYEINIPEDHPSGTFWYHAHKHGSVSAQVSSGMVGALIIEGGMDDLAELSMMQDRVFVLEQLSYAFPQGSDVGVIEESNVDQVFGPTRWAALNRHTMINGVVLPKITLRPGEVQRWRFILAGVRETVFVRLVRSDGLGPPIPLHEIAADGLPLGRRVSRVGPVELWPGYRSDVLVEAPLEPGEYLLVDDNTTPNDSINAIPQPLKFLARVVVEGGPMAMAFPDDADMRSFRLPSIPAEDIAAGGQQSTTYQLGGAPFFRIDNRPYDPSEPRRLILGATDTWTLRTGGTPGIPNAPNVPHVFHIHVNPFEILSDTDDTSGQNSVAVPHWRDTYVVRPGRTVKFVTNYRRYIGDFVQHCHILDHEDQGMMEQIRIDPPGGLMNESHHGRSAAHAVRRAGGAHDMQPPKPARHSPGAAETAPSPKPAPVPTRSSPPAAGHKPS